MSVSQWMFPPLAEPTFFENNYLSNNIVTFLNTSTAFWPFSGWGKTAVYSNDIVNLQVQNQTFASIGFIGNLHCMPCRQRLDSNDEALNWDACRYGRADNLADLISTQIAFPSRDERSFITAKWYVNMANPLPESTANEALMCTVGLQSRSAYELSKPFRLVNSARSSPVTYQFDSTQPEGQRMTTPTPGDIGSAPTATPVSSAAAGHGHQHTGLRSAEIAGIVVGAGLAGVGVFFAICWFIFKRKRSAKAAAGASKEAIAKEEEAAGDVLPSYEKPPEYVEVQPATK